jgi:dienelactone hydrolase
LCRIRFRTLNGEKIEQKLVVYPNAYHSFDFEEPDEYFQGHLLQYDPEATADAIIQTRDFLAKYLKSSE